MIEWVNFSESKGAILTDKILIEKALKVSEVHKVEEFKASHGWLQKFKVRHHLDLKKWQGEAQSNLNVNYDGFKDIFQKSINEYADETRIFNKLIPSINIWKNS